MIKTFEDRLKRVLDRIEFANTPLEKESIVNDLDILLIDTFNLVNESFERERDDEFVSRLQNLESKIAEIKDQTFTKLFKS